MKRLLGYAIVLLISLQHPVASVEDCEKGTFFWCYSSRLIRSFIDKLNESEKPLVILPGLEIVSTGSDNKTEKKIDTVEDSVVERMANYLLHHEINIKLADLLDSTKLIQYMGVEVEQSEPASESRKKDGKMYMVAVSLMFGKLLAVLGLGSIGALAMKALGVASMALLMAGVIGLKSLHHTNEEPSHHVQYVTEGHHRRRRQIYSTLPYNAWEPPHAIKTRRD